MLEKVTMMFTMAYLTCKAKYLEEKEKHEDGMATIEAVILIAVVVILALVVVNALTKGDDGKGLIGHMFDKIKEKFDSLFG